MDKFLDIHLSMAYPYFALHEESCNAFWNTEIDIVEMMSIQKKMEETGAIEKMREWAQKKGITLEGDPRWHSLAHNVH